MRMSVKDFIENPLWERITVNTDGYHQGKKFPLALEIIDPWGRMLQKGGAAESFRAMQRESGYILRLNYAFRGMDEQSRFYDRMLKQRAAKRKDPSVKVVQAARPGYSNHQMGLAIDVRRDNGGREFVKRHGRRFGWIQTVKSEPWHFVYKDPMTVAMKH